MNRRSDPALRKRDVEHAASPRPGALSRRLLLLAALAGTLAAGCVPDGPERTTGITTAPPPPSHLEVRDVDTSRVELSWRHDGGPDEEATVAAFRIYRDGERVASSDSTAWSDRGLRPDTEYEYRVSAVDEAGAESDPSASVLARTDAVEEQQDEGDEQDENDGDGGDGDNEGDNEGEGEGDDDGDEEDDTPPSAPSELKARSESSTSVELKWEAAEDPESGIDAYVIYRKLHKEGGVHDHYAGGEEVARTSSTEYTDTDLEPETEYVYRVSAVNGAGLEGDRSDPEKVKTAKEKDD